MDIRGEFRALSLCFDDLIKRYLITNLFLKLKTDFIKLKNADSYSCILQWCVSLVTGT